MCAFDCQIANGEAKYSNAFFFLGIPSYGVGKKKNLLQYYSQLSRQQNPHNKNTSKLRIYEDSIFFRIGLTMCGLIDILYHLPRVICLQKRLDYLGMQSAWSLHIRWHNYKLSNGCERLFTTMIRSGGSHQVAMGLNPRDAASFHVQPLLQIMQAFQLCVRVAFFM